MLRRKMMIFLVVVMGLFLGGVKNSWAWEINCSDYAHHVVITYTNNTSDLSTQKVRTIAHEDFKIEAPLGGRVCDYSDTDKGTWLFYTWEAGVPVIRECQQMSDGTFQFKEIQKANWDISKGHQECIDGVNYIGNPTASFVWSKSTKCTWTDIDGKVHTRTDGQAGCVGPDNPSGVFKCDGTTGAKITDGVNQCVGGQICKPYGNYTYTCEDSHCSEVDGTNSDGSKGDKVDGVQGDVKCFPNTDIIKKCNYGNWKIVEGGNCFSKEQVCEVASGVPQCVSTTAKMCHLINGNEVGQAFIGKDTCYNNTIYECTDESYPNFTNPVACGKDAAGKQTNCYINKTNSFGACSSGSTPKDGIPENDLGATPENNTIYCGASKDTANPQINTVLGCIPVGGVEQFVPWLLNILFSIAGGIAFLMMVYGFILIATSSGDEKKMAGAKETITSAITGLLVCIFALFILRLIAVNILKIPGL